MKLKALALMVPVLLIATATHAAEIYNKDGNKLDLYGKVDGLHYFSDDASKDGDQPMPVSVSKVKPKLTTSSQATASGNITFRPTTLKAAVLLKTPRVSASRV